MKSRWRRRIFIIWNGIQAVLSGIYYRETLEALLQSAYLGDGGYAGLVAADGCILAGSNTGLNGKDLFEGLEARQIIGDTSLEEARADMKAGRAGLLSYEGAVAASLVMYRPLSQNSWYLVQNLPSSVLNDMESAVSKSAVSLAIGLTVSFAALFAGIYLWLRMRHSDLYVENQRVKAIVDASYSLIFEFDQSGEAVAWYGDAGKVFDIENGALTEYIHPEDLTLFTEQMKELKEGKLGERELRIRTREGIYHWCGSRLIAMRNPGGKLIRILGIIRDIDDHKQKELSLADERDLFAEAIHMLGDTYYKILVLNLETGRYRFIREEYAEAPEIRKARQEYSSCDSYSFWYDGMAESMIHPDYLDAFEKKLSLDSIRKSVADNTDRHSVIYKRRGPVEGEYKWAQTEWIPCEGGEEVILYVKDITDERIAEENHRRELERAFEEVKRANRVKTEFLEHISHDLRTPMNAIMGMNEMTYRAAQEKDFDKISYYTGRVRLTAEYLTLLLADLVDVSHMQKLGLELVCERFDMGILLIACREFFQYVSKEKHVSFRTEGCLSGMYVGDYRRLKQLVFNLIENAVKFNKPGGSVLLRVRTEAETDCRDRFFFEIKDTGIGMDEEQLGKLFQPFDRGEHIVSETFAGTGLGLFIAKIIVDAMGGEIQVILTDIMMPEMDGYALAERIRELSRKDSGTVRIVALTASSVTVTEEKVLACGINEILDKPFDVKKFNQLIRG